MTVPDPPRANAAQLEALRADLHRANYTHERVAQVLGPVASSALHREQSLPAERMTRGSADPVSLLLRLFALGLPLTAEEVGRALPSLGLEGALSLPLIQRTGDEFVATCDMRPYGQDDAAWWVASDLSEMALREALPTSHVLGIGGASTTLASWAPRPQVGRALDLGTGCGVQALHVASHAETIVATDISQRALAFAEFNAALNEVALETRQGSLLEPALGEQFDLVVSNPPFVITPRAEGVPHYEYRDAGTTAGHATVEELVTTLGDVLAPGGIAQLLGNWEVPADTDWREVLGQWLDRTDLDAWVIQRESQDPAAYAETWARDGGHRPGTPAFDHLYAAWLDDFATRGVERIGFGIITLHRPERTGSESALGSEPRAPWRDLEEVVGPVASPMGPTINHGVQARTWLADHDEADLLDRAWTVAPDVTEERVGWPGAHDPSVIQLRQGGGLRRVVPLSTVTAGFVGACDGDLTARQICSGVAVLLEQPSEDIIGEVAPVLYDLIADGLLVSPPLQTVRAAS